jgi:hypothetical protein
MTYHFTAYVAFLYILQSISTRRSYVSIMLDVILPPWRIVSVKRRSRYWR